MSALVRYIIWFVFDAIGMGARGRGPGFGSDINLVPTSHSKPRDLRSTDEELTGSWYHGPKNSGNVIPFPISHRKDEVDDEIETQKQAVGTRKILTLFYWSLVGWLLFNL